MITISFLAEWALRSSVLILSGALVVWALRVKDPSIRLMAWTAMLIGSLAIPLLHRTAPHVSVPVAVQSGFVSSFEATPVPAPIHQLTPSIDWSSVGVSMYFAGAGILLLRILIGLGMSLRMVRRSRVTEIGVRESDSVSAPVTLGIIRPVIVLPVDWRDWPSAKLAAVLGHERSHIGRFDPAVQFLSAIHRAMLWYSPLSWFLHSRIVRVAEEASDDAALGITADRPMYAEVLLEFMRTGVRGTRHAGVPMARYGRLEARIRRVLDGTVLSRGVTRWGVAAIVAMACPVVYLVAAAGPQAPAAKKATVVQVPAPVGYLRGLGYASPSTTVTVRTRTEGVLQALNFKEGESVQAGQLLATIETSTDWRKALDSTQSDLAQAEMELKSPANADGGGQLRVRIANDRTLLTDIRHKIQESEIRAPISGITGLLQIDPGNLVHPNDANGIVVITQLNPMSVLFTIPEDSIQQVLSRMRKGAPPVTEAFDRTNSTRIASGHLVAVDNQIDEKTGMAKLKAVFENKNGALFPNQFVNVRLFLD
jgi:hypothetical protein